MILSMSELVIPYRSSEAFHGWARMVYVQNPRIAESAVCPAISRQTSLEALQVRTGIGV